ncbi:hypothetical protein KY314_00395 [Candidatus Woesearchaeota archaeon]|nr:hypothetical protein [Candidatus Woesearchaeota archaeon]
MVEISNKALLILALIAILVSLGGTWLSLSKLQVLSLTGRAPAPVTSGIAQLNITAQAVVNVTNASIDWENVAVGAGNDSCEINSEDGNYYRCSQCTGIPCSTADRGFTFQNIGNVQINVSAQAGKTPANFIGGSLGGGPKYLWKCRNWTNISGTSQVTTYTASTSGSATLIYSNMSPSNSTHDWQAYLDLNLTIPRDTPTGSKTDTITFTAVQT